MNSVVHFEVPSKNKEMAQEFYQTVFGWQFQDMTKMNYYIARSCETDKQFMPKEK